MGFMKWAQFITSFHWVIHEAACSYLGVSVALDHSDRLFNILDRFFFFSNVI